LKLARAFLKANSLESNTRVNRVASDERVRGRKREEECIAREGNCKPDGFVANASLGRTVAIRGGSDSGRVP
jgi:hypothetical protein